MEAPCKYLGFCMAVASRDFLGLSVCLSVWKTCLRQVLRVLLYYSWLRLRFFFFSLSFMILFVMFMFTRRLDRDSTVVNSNSYVQGLFFAVVLFVGVVKVHCFVFFYLLSILLHMPGLFGFPA